MTTIQHGPVACHSGAGTASDCRSRTEEAATARTGTVSAVQIYTTTMEAIVAEVTEQLLAREGSLRTQLGEGVFRPYVWELAPLSLASPSPAAVL